MVKSKARFFWLALLMFSRAGWSQEVTGNLEGRILEAQGKPLAEVSITIRGPSLQGQRGTASDHEGYFRLLRLPVGAYTVKLSHIAHQEVTYENIPVRLGKTTTLGEVRLQSRTVEMAEVVVSGERPVIDPTSTTIGENLQPEAFNNLPVERNFRTIPTLVPQANTSFYGDEANISGSTGSENTYVIDGMNVTDIGLAAGSINLPYNFIKEIEVKTGGYEAEYGRALGGIINVITHSGSNHLHGQLFGFFTNQALGGEGRPNVGGAKVTGFSQYDVGLSLNGPILRDKLWFFAAYNPNVAYEDIALPSLGTYRDKITYHLFTGKLTWQAAANTSIVFTVLGDPSTHHMVNTNFGSNEIANADLLLIAEEEGSISMSLTARQTVNQNLLLEAAISRLHYYDKRQGETERGRNEPIFRDFVNGIFSGGVGFALRVDEFRTAAKMSASLALGKHTLKAGIEYEDNSNARDYRNPSPGMVGRIGDSLYLVYRGRFVGENHHLVPSVFAQDSWLVTKRIRINAGLRWDGQYFVDTNGNAIQTITNQFQPRAGLIYQLGELGSRKLFGSYGRFYEQVPLILSARYHGENTEHRITYDHDPLINPAGGDTATIIQTIHPKVPNLQGQYFDEFILGYEQEVWHRFKLGVRGLYRTLREAIEDAVDPESGQPVIGNPGSGNLSFLPKMKRQYAAVEFTLQNVPGKRLNVSTSYVLSRNYGNYSGLYDQTAGSTYPNANDSFEFPEQVPNSIGLLPNDRTHVFKFSGSYQFPFGLTGGTAFIYQTGTPLNELGGASIFGYYTLMRQRGSAGRAPSLWDLNIRLRYDVKHLTGTYFKPKLVLDAFHLFSPRQAVIYDQVHYFGLDENGNQALPNSNYGKPTRYQSPTTVRLGMEVEF